MKTIQYTWDDVERAANDIVAQIARDQWMPDYVVGITKDGLPLALLISNKLEVRLHTLDVNDDDSETNCWMSEDAFGYNYDVDLTKSRWDPDLRKKILIVNDGNHPEGAAKFEWIKKDWQSTCLPNEADAWSAVWNKTVRFAVMTEDLTSDFEEVRYSWDKVSDELTIICPWD